MPVPSEPCLFDDWTSTLGGLSEAYLNIIKLVPIVILTFSVGFIFHATWKQIVGMSLVTMFYFLMFTYLVVDFPFNGSLRYLICSFFGGLLVQAYAKWSQELAVILLTPALFISVPGGAIAHVAIDVAVGSYGATSILDMFYGVLQAAIGVSVGLCLSSLLAHPRGPRVQCRCETLRDRWVGAEAAISSHS